jgi:hypothetical protein
LSIRQKSPIWENLGRISSLFCFDKNFISCLATKVRLYWLDAIKLSVIYYTDFESFNLAQAQLCLFGKSHKTFVYSAKA